MPSSQSHLHLGDKPVNESFTVYGAQGSGSVAVEAALTLLGLPYVVIETPPWGTPEEREKLAKVSPLGQVPVLLTPSGHRVTESAAILIGLADAFAPGVLAPAVGRTERADFLRWMTFIPANIYPMYTVRDEAWIQPTDPAARAELAQRAAERIIRCWRVMEAEVEPRPFILGEQATVLDLYVTVVSRWTPRRRLFKENCPRLAAVAEQLDAEPLLQDFWAERFPFEPGWDVMPASG